MNSQEITIHVTAEAAGLYQSASEQEKRKLDLLLSLKLSECSRSTRPLQEIMKDAAKEASRSGLTPEMLSELLDE